MNPLIFFMHAASSLTESLTKHKLDLGEMLIREFPDEETYIKIISDVRNREVIFISTLDRPNHKLLPLLFAATTCRDLGATKVDLVAPYLAYMRQDKQFHPGEGITSKYFASIVSNHFDWIMTIDPHLHRYHSMNEIFTIPSTVLHATTEIATWIKNNISHSIIIGPDKESEQWVAEVAQMAQAPYVILNKVRNSDWDVVVTLPDLKEYQNYTPVLVDDIISTGQTMIGAVNALKELNMAPPICIAVHAVFADDAYQNLQKSGVAKIVTCNTIAHQSNGIDVAEMLVNTLESGTESESLRE